MKRSKTAAGFTLIELLVVLGIISILTAILMPVFQRVRERGRSATCQSNLRQLNMAMQQYVANNDSAYPNDRTYWQQQVSTDSLWQQAIQPYIKNSQVFECPTEFKFPGIGTPENTDYTFITGFYTDLVTTSPPGFRERLGSHEARHSNADPTKVMTVIDSALDGPLVRVQVGVVAGGPYRGVPIVVELSTRHSGGANYGFLDGHVKWLTPQAAGDGYRYMRREIPRDRAPI